MAGNWGNVQQGLVSGYQVGRSTGGGRLGALGANIKMLADRLREDELTKQATQRDILGKAVEGVIKGDIQPAQSNEEGFELSGVGRFKQAETLDKQLKRENLNYMKGINAQMSGEGSSGGASLVARRADTGEEVPLDQAREAIAQGDRNFIINQKQVTRAGVKENALIKAPDLTTEEKQYEIASKRIVKSLDNLQNIIYPKLNRMRGNKNWQALQAQGLPFWAIGDQNIEDFKSELVRLKSDIPFLRGGKQLTSTEAKRVDILLNPFGKSDATKQADIQRFKDEFLSGVDIMVGGVSALKKPTLKANTSQYSIGQTVMKGGKNYVIKGFDTDGEPLVDLAR